MAYNQPLIISMIGAGLICLIVYKKDIKKLLNKTKQFSGKTKTNKDIKDIMFEDNLTFDEARKELFLDEIVKALEIDVSHWEVNRYLRLIKGDRVSFVDKEVGLVQGIFLGIKKPELLGYDDMYVVRDTRKSIIRQASISYVKEETINVYK